MGKMTIEELEIRFGSTAVGKGIISSDQLIDALEIQERENMARGKHRLIGKILFDMGFITLQQIDEVLVFMPLSAAPKWSECD